jgi:2-oxoglutarate ferredoxin oxidoreductase subunit delta
MPKPEIDFEKCQHCGVCVDVCPLQCFEKKKDKVEITKPNECIGCRSCEVQCPQAALTVKD